MKKFLLFAPAACFPLLCAAYSGTENNASASSGSITVYFNHPVNNAVSAGVNAVYLNQTLDDTLVAYINRSKYTLDIAVYNFIQSGPMANIATAINNAYTRGVKIRWIYNGSSSNSGLSQLNSNIHTLGSPTTSTYGIMHNKFMIVDANSADPNDPLVWTGSCNWDEQQFNNDYNNTIIIQDQALAQAYRTEFNEMWGDTGLVPNTTASKFGPMKTDNTPHTFTIGSRTVECYFSPSDGTNSKILNAINTADNTLYFGVYTFTMSNDANAIKTKFLAGVYTAGIMDQYSTSYSAYSTLNPVMGNMLKIYSNATYIYHNKFLLVDACDSTSDPIVETGSHNWSNTADTKNDENILVIHSALIANEYYQAFNQDFTTLGGTLSPPCPLGVEENQNSTGISIFPVPADDMLNIQNPSGEPLQAILFDPLGREVKRENCTGTSATIDLSDLSNGIYFVQLQSGKKMVSEKIIVAHR